MNRSNQRLFSDVRVGTLSPRQLRNWIANLYSFALEVNTATQRCIMNSSASSKGTRNWKTDCAKNRLGIYYAGAGVWQLELDSSEPQCDPKTRVKTHRWKAGSVEQTIKTP